MNQKYFIGVDISKSKVDYAVMDQDMNIVVHGVVLNQRAKLRSKLRSLIKQLQVEIGSMLVCCEHTGIYNRPLEDICVELGIYLWEEHPIKIKRSSSELRGKSDKQDALRIAEYAVRYRDRAIEYQPVSAEMKALKDESKVRESLIACRVALLNQLREAKSHDQVTYQTLEKGYRQTLKDLNKNIEKCQQRIVKLVESQEEIQRNMELITSIKGVGWQTALLFILYTDNFKRFRSAKHLACYAGVVPFRNESGTIVKPQRISKMANLVLKKVLHTAALSACRYNTELSQYYQRKVAEGKNKMSVINAVRNKLAHRIFAVVQRQTPYIEVGHVPIKKEHEIICF